MRRFPRVAFVLIAVLVMASASARPAQAQKRVAFVVGIDKYDNLGSEQQLKRAVNDAHAVATAFKALGFEVMAAENLGRAAFSDQFQHFLDKIAPGDTTAMYFSGHGVEIEGLNFLLPRDVPNLRYGRQEQIKRESLSVAEILLDLRGRNSEITLLILDACRDHPLVPEEQRSIGRRGGLAPQKSDPPRGTFIMYSAGAGETALDRLPGNDPDPTNSVFTRKLLPLLTRKGLALHDLARQLRADVVELAASVPHTQRPAYYDGVLEKYCLAGCDGAQGTTKRNDPPPIHLRSSEATEAWDRIKETSSIAVLQAYATRYADSIYAELAKARVADLRRQEAAAAKAEQDRQAEQRKRTEAETERRKVEDEARSRADVERRRLALLQEEQRKRAEAPAPPGSWRELGCQTVSLTGTDRDVIRVGRTEGRFRAVRVYVRDADIEMLGLRAIYANGEPDDIPLRQVVRQGERTRPLDLKGHERSVDRFELVYRALANTKRVARVCIEALQ